MPSLLTTVRDLDRLRQITSVLARHGFGEIVRRSGWGQLLTPRSDDPGSEPPKIGDSVWPWGAVLHVPQETHDVTQAMHF